MSNTSEIVSPEHYEFLQLNQVGRLSDRTSKVVDSEEQTLRQFNAELLQKIGDFRKKTLELSSSENELKTRLAIEAKKASDRERDLVSKYENEIAGLRRELGESKRVSEESNDEWSRRLAKLSDESWAQGLENENLKRMEEELESKLGQFQAELDRASSLEDSRKQALETLSHENARIRAELVEAEQAVVEARKSFESLNIQLAKVTEGSRDREAQMITAYEALRAEYANMDRCYNESNMALVKLQNEMRERYKQHENELQELTTYLTDKAAGDSALIRDENSKLREALLQRDVRLDADRAAITQWKEQLTSLDQHLKSFSEKLKKSRGEMIRLSKTLEDEIQFSLKNPFMDYLEMAELEITQIAQQLQTTSSMSPLKAKLDTRLSQAHAHRDGIKAILEKSGAQLSEHSRSIQTLIKGLEYLT